MFRIITEGANFREHVLLKNGQGILLRPGGPEDVDAVSDLMRRVSRESLQMRFMATIAEVPRKTIEEMCTGVLSDRACIVALCSEASAERIIGIGNYIEMGNGRTAEVAFLVDDSYQGRGISTLILERLAGIAAAHGFLEFEAEVLWENTSMLGVFESSGFELRRDSDSGVVHVEFPVREAPGVRERGESRERLAVANSLAPLLRPRVVAVVGASRSRQGVGNMIFRHILHAGYGGTVYPVNPEAESVHGVKAYPTIADLPEKVDLAVVAVPAPSVFEVAEHAVQAGAKGLLVISAGFAESGEEGVELQRQLVKLVRSHGVRLIGPNCLGVMNTAPEVYLNASLAPEIAPRGSVAFFSQSAALGLVILEHVARRGLGFSHFVLAGNRADVSGNDLLQFWEEDPSTEMVLLYLETFGNPRKFTRIARRFTQKKPILCVKGARSPVSQRMVRFEEGKTFGGVGEVDALFRQAGIIRAETLDEMFDLAAVLSTQPLPAGPRVAVISNSHGVATLLADTCESNGLVLGGPGLIDLGAVTAPEDYERSCCETFEDEDVDALIVSFACVGQCSAEAVSRAIVLGIRKAEQNTGTRKPVLLCLMGEEGSFRFHPEDGSGEEDRVFPSFVFPESAPRALARAYRYAEYRRKGPGRVVFFDDIDPAEARRLVHEAIERKIPEDTAIAWLDLEDSMKLLGFFGLDLGQGDRGPEGLELELRIRLDRYFGPLVEVGRRGQTPIVRITPMSDRDIQETATALGIDETKGFMELLGRISQMIEEIPWLGAMEADARVVGHHCRCLRARIGLRTEGSSHART